VQQNAAVIEAYLGTGATHVIGAAAEVPAQ